MIRLLIGLSLLAVILSACEKKPSGSNYVDLNPNPPYVNIVLEEYTDSLEVWGIVTFSYHLQTTGSRVYQPEALLDGQLIQNLPGNEGTFNFFSTSFINGTHTLTLRFRTGSRNGSIASGIGGEEYLVSQDYVLLIANGVPGRLSMTSVVPENGRLSLSWQRFSSKRFERYIVNAGKVQNGFLTGKSERVNTTDQDQLTGVDSTYIGGTRSFAADVRSVTGTSQGIPLTIDYPEPQYIKPYALVGGTGVQLGWTTCQFDSNFGAYKIFRNDELLMEANKVADTVFVDSIAPFGGNLLYRLETTSNASRFNQTLTDTINARIGQKRSNGWKVTGVPATNSIYHSNPERIWRTTPDGETLLSANVTENLGFAISPDGSKLVLANTGMLINADPLTLAVIDTFDFSAILGFPGYPLYERITVSNNSIVAFFAYEKVGQANLTRSAVLIDMAAKSLLWRGPLENVSNVLISPTGEYFSRNNALWNVGNGFPSEIGGIDYDILFHPDGELLYEMTTSRHIVVRRCSDLQGLRSFTLPSNVEDPQLDPFSMRISVFHDDSEILHVYDSETGTKLVEVPTVLNNGPRFVNNWILAGGYGIHISAFMGGRLWP